MNRIDQLKQIYHTDSLSHEKVDIYWQELATHLPDQQRPHLSWVSTPFVFATLGSVLVFLIATVTVASHATPNTPIYSVRVVLERMKTTVIETLTLPKSNKQITPSASSSAETDPRRPEKNIPITPSETPSPEKKDVNKETNSRVWTEIKQPTATPYAASNKKSFESAVKGVQDKNTPQSIHVPPNTPLPTRQPEQPQSDKEKTQVKTAQAPQKKVPQQ